MNSKNADKKRIVEAKEKTSSWDAFQSRNCVFLRFHRERFNSFWDLVVYENSHDIAQSLTSCWISNFQSVDENDRRNNKIESKTKC